jgi:hypothetical protein
MRKTMDTGVLVQGKQQACLNCTYILFHAMRADTANMSTQGMRLKYHPQSDIKAYDSFR